MRSAVGVPVFVEGTLWGALTAASTGAVLAPELKDVLLRFAELTSAALANAQAQERLRFRARLERGLRMVASAGADLAVDETELADLVATQIVELLDTPFAAVIRLDGPDRMRIAGRAGELELPVTMVLDDPATVAGVIARTGESARIDDYAAVPGPVGAHAVAMGITGAVGVPVRVSGTVWGCGVSMTRRAGDLPADSELLLERFAGVLAVALANAASRSALRQEARLRQALLEVSAASASGEPDAATLFGLVASRVAELLDAPCAMVVRTDDDTAVVVGCSGLPKCPRRWRCTTWWQPALRATLTG